MKYILGNVKIGVRLGVGFAVILALLCLVGILATYQSSRVYDGTEQIANRWLGSVQVLGDIRGYANAVRRATVGSVMESTPEGKQVQRARRDEVLTRMSAAMQAYQKLISSQEEEQLNQSMQKAWKEYLVIDGKLLELSEAGEGSFSAARAVTVGDSATSFAAVARLIDDGIRLNSQGGVAALATAAKDYDTGVLYTGVLVIATLMVGGVIAFAITRSITGPLRGSVSVAETVSRGDLNSQIEVSRRDEVGELLQSLKAMNGNLHNVVSDIRMATETVTIASQEIASGNVDLSARTEEQAASLEETAASMTQLTETVRQNADNARQADTFAARATDMADVGDDAVQSLVGTIERINGSSAKISDITGVIEGIAFQTNILALNAAVEAARAGEQGRGFAVVASEVRNLAQRSAAAAKEIKELIGSSVTMIEDGAQQAIQVSATMGNVKQAIKQVSDIVGEIAAASQEQSRRIEHVNQAVSQMDEVTQQNAALVEQATAAAHSLEEQAKNLMEAVSVFKIGENVRLKSNTVATQPIARNSARKVSLIEAPEKLEAVERKSQRPKGVVMAFTHRSTANEWETF
jgi:methyl-accepting chemotaxis protein